MCGRVRLGGKAVELVRFPEESHDLSRSGRPDRRVERLRRIGDWYERFLGTAAIDRFEEEETQLLRVPEFAMREELAAHEHPLELPAYDAAAAATDTLAIETPASAAALAEVAAPELEMPEAELLPDLPEPEPVVAADELEPEAVPVP